MNHFRRRIDRLRRQLDARHVTDDDADGPPAPIPVRYYELDANGERVFVEPNEGDLELERKAWQLVHGDRRRGAIRGYETRENAFGASE